MISLACRVVQAVVQATSQSNGEMRFSPSYTLKSLYQFSQKKTWNTELYLQDLPICKTWFWCNDKGGQITGWYRPKRNKSTTNM